MKLNLSPIPNLKKEKKKMKSTVGRPATVGQGNNIVEMKDCTGRKKGNVSGRNPSLEALTPCNQRYTTLIGPDMFTDMPLCARLTSMMHY